MKRFAICIALTLCVTGGSARAALPGPALTVSAVRLADALDCPAKFTHPVVLLVHGTSVTADENWAWNYVRALPKAGFDVCTVLLPDRELGDIQITSEYVVYAIRTIAHAVDGKIDVVGLSQGALQPRWAIRWWPDIRNLVDDYVSMAGTNHGALFADAACVTSCLPSLWQQVQRSKFLAALNASDETPGNVSYTSVYSLTDEVIQPSEPTAAAAITGASNIAVQDVCPGRYVGHVQSMADAVYYGAVIDALKHAGPADASRIDRIACLQTFMPAVDPVEAATRIADVYVTAGIVQTQHEKIAAEPPLKDYAK